MSAAPRSKLMFAALRDPALWVMLATILLVARVAAWYSQIYHHNVVDDAYISFQYAKNLALGRGLVFNPGERVEGYTNFLWVLTLAPVYSLTRGLHVDFTRAAISINTFIALTDLGLLYVIGRRLFAGGWVASAIVLLLCALDNSFQGYAVSGFENHMVMLWLLCAVLVWLGTWRYRALLVGVLMALAAMTRPDAGLFMAAFVGAHCALLPFRRIEGVSRSERSRTVCKTAAGWLLVFGPYFAWRYHYYGMLLPNTFYLKVGSTLDGIARGWDYTQALLADRYYLPVLALFALRWAHRPLILWLTLFVLAHTAYVIYVGGDFYSGQRYYVAILPIVYLLIGRVVHGIVQTVRASRLWKFVRRSALATAAILAVCAGGVCFGLFEFTTLGMERGPYANEYIRWGAVVDNNVRYMKWLRTLVRPGQSMALGDIGAAGFFADLAVVDALGVVDPHTAHQKVTGFGRGKAGHEKNAGRDYMLSRNPTYVKWGWISGDLSPRGYYVFTDFPPGLDVDGLWVRDDRNGQQPAAGSAIHFDSSELAWWSPSGDAFVTLSCTVAPRGQHPPFGQQGSYLNTFTADLGDRATGRLVSPQFALVGDEMVLRVGGGRDPDNLRVSLLIDGEPVFWATGHDHEVLGRRLWRISPYKGRYASLEVIDRATGNWGHILVDEVEQWQDGSRPTAQ
jgi:arabinofuranosyltransferase